MWCASLRSTRRGWHLWSLPILAGGGKRPGARVTLRRGGVPSLPIHSVQRPLRAQPCGEGSGPLVLGARADEHGHVAHRVLVLVHELMSGAHLTEREGP